MSNTYCTFIYSYKKYVTLDPLGVVTKTRSSLEEDASTLADAPSTIMQREEMMRFETKSFNYNPGLGTVPELSVPESLPDLLGRFMVG